MSDEQPQPTSFAYAVSLFEDDYLPARNLAIRTRHEYHRDVAQVVEFLNTQLHLDAVSQVDKRHLESFLAELDHRGLKGSSRRRKVAVLKAFFGHLYWSQVISIDPTLRLIPPKKEASQPRVLTEEEYQRLQLACAHDVRDSALIELILQTGMRLSEVAALRIPELELPARPSREAPPGAVHIHGKGKKERTVTLNWKACKALRSWLAVRPPLPNVDRVFVTKFKKPLGPRGIQHLVTKYLGEAQISGAHTHTLRHTFGTHMARKGTKIDIIRKALGHESLDTTSIYIDLAREQMDKELQENAL